MSEFLPLDIAWRDHFGKFIFDGYRKMTKTVCSDSDIEFDSKDGWISIKDQIPRVDRRVLFLRTDNSITIGILTYFGYFSTERFNDDALNVTHWQPLPKPPN